MAITDIVVTGYVFQDDGDALAGATVELLETGTSTVEATYNSGTGTTAAGLWTFTETSLDTTYDVKITHGTSVRRSRMWADEITLKGVDASYMKIRGADTAAAPLYFIADKGDNNIDIWTVQAADGGAFTFESFASGSTVAQLTITPHATVASSSVTFPGILDVNGSVDWDVTLVQVDSSGDINLVSTNDAADAIYLRENAGTSGTIKIHADQGTSESSIQLLSDAGGVDINAATGKDVDIAGGTVNLTSSDDAASAIYLRANAGTSETIKIHADQGTGAASISAVSDAGGITLDAGLDIVLSADGGNVTMDDGTTTIFDFDVDGTALTIHDDEDTGDKAVITMAQHGALTIVTTDDNAAAANIQITADGTAELAGTTVTLDSAGDVILDAGGTDIFLKDDGTLFGTLTNNSGELLIKSSSSGTTAATFTGANVVFAGTVEAATNLTIGDTVITDGVITDSTGLRFTADVSFGADGTNQDVNFYGDTSGRDMSWDAGNNALLIKDNAGLYLGDGTDLQLWHGSDVSYIRGINYPLQIDLNTGDLIDAGQIRTGGATAQTAGDLALLGSNPQVVLERSGGSTDWGVINSGGTFRIRSASDAASWTNEFNIAAGGKMMVLAAITPSSGGDGMLIFPDIGTAPGTLASDTAIFYADDVGGTTEAFAIDEAGNAAQLTPHPATFLDAHDDGSIPFPWAYHASNDHLGSEIHVDMSGLVAAVEALTGKTFAYIDEYTKTPWTNSKDIPTWMASRGAARAS